MHAGKPGIQGALNEAAYALPLPSVEPVTEWTKFATGNGPVPRGAYPAALKNIGDLAGIVPPDESTPDLTMPTLPDVPDDQVPVYILRRP